MEKKVLIPSDISQPGKDYLAEKGYTIKMGRGTDEQTILEDVACLLYTSPSPRDCS